MKPPTIGALALLVFAALGAFAPTQTGDPIGTVTMTEDGSLLLRLRSVQCGGALAEGRVKLARTERTYESVIASVGGLRRGETKVMHAAQLPPCLTGK
jgi:hypothetical protein